MAWTTLLNSLFLPGKKILGSTGMALRDNLVAALQGDAGAERLRIGALQRLNPGTQVRSRHDATKSSSTVSLSEIHTFAFMQAGTIRVAFENRINAGSGGSAAVVRRRNAAETTLATFSNTTTFVAQTVDCAVLPGDVIIFKLASGNISNTAEVRNFRLQTNGEDLWPGAECNLEGNTFN